MRLKTIHIDSFRGIKNPTSLFLDSDLIVINGENGTGKTSIIDAIQWIITGKVNRLHGSRDITVYKNSYKNVISDNTLTVELEFTKNGRNYYLIRTGRENGSTDILLLRKEGKNIPKNKVKQLLKILFPDNYWGQYVLLEQYNLSQFITDSNPRSRYDLFIKFLGLEDNTSLRNLINKTIYHLNKKIEGLRVNFDTIKEKKEFTDEFDKELFISRIERKLIKKIDLIKTEISVGINFRQKPQIFELNDKISKYFSLPKLISSDDILKIRKKFSNEYDQLKSESRGYKKDLYSCYNMIDSIKNEKKQKESIIVLKNNEKNLKNRRIILLNKFKSTTKEVDEIESKIRKMLKENTSHTSSKEGEFSHFFSLGRQFIEHSRICPLCDSQLEFDLTEKLDLIISKYQEQLDNMRQREERLTKILREQRLNLNKLSGNIASLDADISKNKRQISIIESEIESLRQSIFSLIGQTDQNQDLDHLITELIRHREDIEANNERKEIEIELIETKRTFISILNDSFKQTLEDIKLSDERTDKLGREIQNNLELFESLKQSLDELLKKEKSLVKSFISIFENDFQIIYNKLNPHPFFNQVEINIDYKQPGGEIYFLSKVDNSLISEDINIKNVFSTTQNNILAISIFLAINQQINRLERIPIILDDPVQAMDSQNLIKIVEMVTTLSKQQQIIVTTSSEKFLVLLKRYFQYFTDKSTLTEHILYDWSKEGPVRKERTIKSFKKVDSIKTVLSSIKIS